MNSLRAAGLRTCTDFGANRPSTRGFESGHRWRKNMPPLLPKSNSHISDSFNNRKKTAEDKYVGQLRLGQRSEFMRTVDTAVSVVDEWHSFAKKKKTESEQMSTNGGLSAYTKTNLTENQSVPYDRTRCERAKRRALREHRMQCDMSLRNGHIRAGLFKL